MSDKELTPTEPAAQEQQVGPLSGEQSKSPFTGSHPDTPDAVGPSAEDVAALNPVEKLRFFLSTVLAGQAWLDTEPLFDDIEAAIQAAEERAREAEGKLVAIAAACEGKPVVQALCDAYDEGREQGRREGLEKAAEIQEERSRNRHGYDKYSDAEAIRAEKGTCRRCGGEMKPSKAIENTYTGTPDFPDGDVVTISLGGPGKLVDCLKCRQCGHSVRAEKGE